MTHSSFTVGGFYLFSSERKKTRKTISKIGSEKSNFSINAFSPGVAVNPYNPGQLIPALNILNVRF